MLDRPSVPPRPLCVWLHLMATLGPYLGLTISPPSLQACSHSTVFLDRHLQTTGHT